MNGMVAAVSEAPRVASGAVPFPSVAWFERLGALMREDRVLHEHLGDVECVARFKVLGAGPSGAPWTVQVTFDGFEPSEIREVADDGSSDLADFVVEADLATWRKMIESIAAGRGRPPLDQTLNFLSLPGVPVRVWSADTVRRDAFFRFNQSLQEFFNASHRFATTFPAA